MLNTDIALQILLLADELIDSRSEILSARVFLDAFNSRRKFIFRTVFCREIQNARHGLSEFVQAACVVSRLNTNATFDAIMIYEAIQPPLLETSYLRWVLRLADLYGRLDPSPSGRKLALLEEAYARLLKVHHCFSLKYTAPLKPQSLYTKRLSNEQQDVCRELIKEYNSRNRLLASLAVQNNVLRRLPLDHWEANDWRIAIMKTYRLLHDFDGAVKYAMNFYRITRRQQCSEAALRWARAIVAEYSDAGRHVDAVQQQRMFLADIEPGTQEQIAWIRRLLVLLKRADRMEEVLTMQTTVWEQMPALNPCFFGWARQLCNDYRRAGRKSEAVAVIEEMYHRAKLQAESHEEDDNWKFHVVQSARTLVAEYKDCGRTEDARLVQMEMAMAYGEEAV